MTSMLAICWGRSSHLTWRVLCSFSLDTHSLFSIWIWMSLPRLVISSAGVKTHLTSMHSWFSSHKKEEATHGRKNLASKVSTKLLEVQEAGPLTQWCLASVATIHLRRRVARNNQITFRCTSMTRKFTRLWNIHLSWTKRSKTTLTSIHLLDSWTRCNFRARFRHSDAT